MDTEDKKLTAHMLKELADCQNPLTKWEQGFLADVTDQFDRKGFLTEGQFEKLKEIYEEKTA